MLDRGNRYITIFIWCCFLVIDILIACAIAELWIRAFVPVQNICYYHDHILGDRRCPNQKTYGYVQEGYTNILETNSEGFHDIERTVTKREHTLRIEYYGDSLISGVGVPTNETIPSQLETILNSERETSTDAVEVLNMASAEDSTCAQLLLFRLIGKKYSPDIVICHFMADFRDNIFETHQRTRSPYFILNKQNQLEFVPPIPVDLTTPIERLKRSSLLIRLFANKLLSSRFYNDLQKIYGEIFSFNLYNWIKIFKSNIGATDSAGHINPKISNTISLLEKKAWPLTLRLIQEFQKEADSIHAKFILIDGIRFTPNIAGHHKNEDLERFCHANKITYIPIYQVYDHLKKRKPKSLFFLNDGHPTGLGNQILSKAIAQKIHKILFQNNAEQ